MLLNYHASEVATNWNTDWTMKTSKYNNVTRHILTLSKAGNEALTMTSLYILLVECYRPLQKRTNGLMLIPNYYN